MPSVSIKICGLSTPETVDAAVGAGASHAGLVFFPRSPRDVTPERARALTRRLPAHVRAVGVFVDPDDALIEAALFEGRVAVVQLHGSETPARAAGIARRFGVEVWKAVPVRTRADLALPAGFRGAADRIVYDAKPPAGAHLPGGLGLRFDWRLLDGFDHPLPWILSGGLDPANVADAVRVTGARAVDVSSGVEREPGVKDVDKIKAFCQAVAS